MQFTLSNLVVIGSVILACCSGLAVEQNYTRLTNLPDQESTYATTGECTRNTISVRREWLASVSFLLSLSRF